MPARRELANAIRALSMDAAQKANSGHAGAPMGTANIAEVLWRDVLKFNPGNPTEAYGWHMRPNFDGQNSEALSAARAVTDKPSPICAKTTIGWDPPGKDHGRSRAHRSGEGRRA